MFSSDEVRTRQAGLKIVHWIQSILVTIYVLEPVGAAAVTSLGWAACRILKLDWIRSAPLWFAGYVLVYNLDRLYPDPADPVNVPVRWRKTLKLRSATCLLGFILFTRGNRLAGFDRSMVVGAGAGIGGCSPSVL